MVEIRDSITQAGGLLKRIKPGKCDLNKMNTEIQKSLLVLENLNAFIGFEE